MNRSDFAGKYKGQEVGLYTLKNANNFKASITNYGARLVELQVPDREGDFDNIVMSHSSMSDLLNNDEIFLGAIVGRYANRIAEGKFELNGKQYELDKNDGLNHLHGGSEGFYRVVWGANQIDDQTLNLSYRAEDGEQGYPGNVGVSVTYKLTDDNELRIKYRAESDQDTIFNITNHPYFNLHGAEDGSTIEDHLLLINADDYTPINKELIPTGELASVAGTPFDFSSPKAIGEDRNADHPQLKFAGYDHNFVLNEDPEEPLTHAAMVQDPGSGRQMNIYTTEPGLQLYVCDRPIESAESAFCLETQHFPDSPNQPDFPSTVLKAFEAFESETVFRFSTNK